MATSAIFSAMSPGGGAAVGGGSAAGLGGSSGSLISGGAELSGQLSGILSGVLQNKWNKDAIQKSRKWQEKMRATAYQTAVQDLRLAGLNPILAATGGGGPAATPSTAVNKYEGVGEGLRDFYPRFLSSAKQSKMLDDQVATVAAGRREAEANADVAGATRRGRTELVYQDVSRAGTQAALNEDLALQARAHRDRTKVQTDLDRSLLPAARAEMELDMEEHGQFLRKFRRVMEALPVIGASVGRSRVRSR